MAGIGVPNESVDKTTLKSHLVPVSGSTEPEDDNTNGESIETSTSSDSTIFQQSVSTMKIKTNGSSSDTNNNTSIKHGSSSDKKGKLIEQLGESDEVFNCVEQNARVGRLRPQITITVESVTSSENEDEADEDDGSSTNRPDEEEEEGYCSSVLLELASQSSRGDSEDVPVDDSGIILRCNNDPEEGLRSSESPESEPPMSVDDGFLAARKSAKWTFRRASCVPSTSSTNATAVNLTTSGESSSTSIASVGKAGDDAKPRRRNTIADIFRWYGKCRGM